MVRVHGRVDADARDLRAVVVIASENPGDLIGKMGVERYNNESLTGIDGQRQVRVDNRMNTREVLGVKPAVAGKDLRLTIDLDLQTVAELAMEGRKGTLTDFPTGERRGE